MTTKRQGDRNDSSLRVEETTFQIVRDDYAGREGWAVLVHNPSLSEPGLLTVFELDNVPYNEWALDDDENMFRLLPEYTNDLQKALKAHRGLRIFGVSLSYLDKRLRAEGIGQRLYAVMLKHLASRKGSLVPNSAYEGATATSSDAKRVWHKLRAVGVKTYGAIAWGGGVDSNVDVVPKSRRRRGFPKGKGYRRTKHTEASSLNLSTQIRNLAECVSNSHRR